MHLAPTSIPHVFVNGKKRAEVHYVEGEQHTKWRVVFKFDGHTLAPEYMEREQNAIERAKHFINTPQRWE